MGGESESIGINAVLRLIFTCWMIELASLLREFLPSVAAVRQHTEENNENERKNDDQNSRKSLFVFDELKMSRDVLLTESCSDDRSNQDI